MARQARAQATREGIIRAAAAVFAAKTYRLATTTEVVEEAGVTQGALYFHFASKKELALAVIAAQHERSMSLAVDGTGVIAMLRLSRALADQIRGDEIVQAGLRLSTESADQFPGEVTTPYLDWIAACRVHVDEARESGELRAGVDPAAAARLLMSTFTGVQTVSLAVAGWTDLDERLDDMWRLLLPALAVPEVAERVAAEELPPA